MSRIGAWIAIFVAVVICAFLYFWLGRTGGDTERSITADIGGKGLSSSLPSSVSPVSAPIERASGKEVKSASFTPSLLLPPENTPLVNILDGLQRSAAEGNISAACRLAFELDRCGEAAELEKAASNLEIAIAKLAPTAPGYTTRVTQSKALTARATTAVKVCDGVSSAKTVDAWQYALVAAQGGHVPSMLRYVRRFGNGLDSNDPAATAEGWVAFKQLAPSMLQSAIDQGSPEAFEFAAFMHLKENARWRLVPYDPIKGIAYYEALKLYAAPAYLETLDRNIQYFVEARKLTSENIGAAHAESVALSNKLAKLSKGSFDFTKGVVMSEDGSHCKMN